MVFTHTIVQSGDPMGIYGSVLTHHSRWTGSIPVACCSVLGSINCSDLVRCG